LLVRPHQRPVGRFPAAYATLLVRPLTALCKLTQPGANRIVCLCLCLTPTAPPAGKREGLAKETCLVNTTNGMTAIPS
jgi:hypothetical protein